MILILLRGRGPRGAFAAATALTCLLLPGCTKKANPAAGAQAGSSTIVTAFYPLYEAASRVGGDQFGVENLTPSGAEPHDLELTPAEVQETLGAKLVLYLGHGFQPALEAVVKRRGGPAIDILEGMTLREAPKDDAGEPGGENLRFDPHVWMDPLLMKDVAARTRTVLEGIDRAHAADFTANEQEYAKELDALDADYRTGLANCSRKLIVTSHAAFGYLAQRYGLEQQTISGLSPESEPSPRRLQDLAALVRSKGVTTIFTETLVSPRTADALAREAGVTTAVLNPIEGLTDDEVRAGKTYTSIMRENLGVLRTALGCSG